MVGSLTKVGNAEVTPRPTDAQARAAASLARLLQSSDYDNTDALINADAF